MDEPEFLSDAIKKKLTKVEHFLIKAKVDPNDWELAHTIKEFKSVKQDVYMDASHIIAFSEKGIPEEKEGYQKITIDLSLLRKISLFYNRNAESKTCGIDLFLKKDSPLQFHDGEIWASLAPRIEDEID